MKNWKIGSRIAAGFAALPLLALALDSALAVVAAPAIAVWLTRSITVPLRAAAADKEFTAY